MPDTFEEALGASQIELTGLESGSDDYSLAMARDPAGDRVAFRFTCPRRTEPVGQPVMDIVVSTAYDHDDCTGTRVCEASTSLQNIDLFEPYKTTAGGDLIYDPKTHDGGAIAALLAQCGCDAPGVESSHLYIHIKLQWEDPVYALFQGYWFTSCSPCRIDDIRAASPSR
jgi:hypothetical protein